MSALSMIRHSRALVALSLLGLNSEACAPEMQKPQAQRHWPGRKRPESLMGPLSSPMSPTWNFEAWIGLLT